MSHPGHKITLNLYGGVGFSMEYNGCSQSQSSLREIKPKKDNENAGNRDLERGKPPLSLWAGAVWDHILRCREVISEYKFGE